MMQRRLWLCWLVIIAWGVIVLQALHFYLYFSILPSSQSLQRTITYKWSNTVIPPKPHGTIPNVPAKPHGTIIDLILSGINKEKPENRSMFGLEMGRFQAPEQEVIEKWNNVTVPFLSRFRKNCEKETNSSMHNIMCPCVPEHLGK